MRKFSSSDMTFCKGNNCDKKETCARWIEHYNLGNRWVSMVMGSDNCPLYTNGGDEDE